MFLFWEKNKLKNLKEQIPQRPLSVKYNDV